MPSKHCYFVDKAAAACAAPAPHKFALFAPDFGVYTEFGVDPEEKSAPIPPASDVSAISVQKGAFVSLVACDTLEYRKFFDNRAVKKTLTIPAWLNTMSEREGINFSAVLQSALKQELHLT